MVHICCLTRELDCISLAQEQIKIQGMVFNKSLLLLHPCEAENRSRIMWKVGGVTIFVEYSMIKKNQLATTISLLQGLIVSCFIQGIVSSTVIIHFDALMSLICLVVNATLLLLQLYHSLSTFFWYMNFQVYYGLLPCSGGGVLSLRVLSGCHCPRPSLGTEIGNAVYELKILNVPVLRYSIYLYILKGTGSLLYF